MSTLDPVIHRIKLVHTWLLKGTSDLTEEQFCRRPAQSAPPIGWHLWHISRFADILQASFANTGGPAPIQVWEAENLIERWGLVVTELGVMQAGMGMDHDRAASLPVCIGKERLMSYAQATFNLVDTIVTHLETKDCNEPRKSIQAYRVDENGRVVAAPPRETTTGGDLSFHLAHSSRHLGMIEALRGLLMANGTVTV